MKWRLAASTMAPVVASNIEEVKLFAMFVTLLEIVVAERITNAAAQRSKRHVEKGIGVEDQQAC